MRKRIILISGKQGVGKTTLAEKLKGNLASHNYTPKIFKFAETIYEMHNLCLPILKREGIRPSDMEKDGELLQVLGTEFGRNKIGRDVWASALRRRVDWELARNANMVAIIDDCRFPNEFDIFPDAFSIRLTALESFRKKRCDAWREDTNHASETALDVYAARGKFLVYRDATDKPEDFTAKMIFEEWLSYEKSL